MSIHIYIYKVGFHDVFLRVPSIDGPCPGEFLAMAPWWSPRRRRKSPGGLMDFWWISGGFLDDF